MGFFTLQDGQMAAKTETITLRIEPAVKAGLKAMANREHRSIANMVEVLIRDYCGRNGISIPEQGERLEGQRKR